MFEFKMLNWSVEPTFLSRRDNRYFTRQSLSPSLLASSPSTLINEEASVPPILAQRDTDSLSKESHRAVVRPMTSETDDWVEVWESVECQAIAAESLEA